MAANACRSAAVAVASNATLKWVPSRRATWRIDPLHQLSKKPSKARNCPMDVGAHFLFSDPLLTNVKTPDILALFDHFVCDRVQ